MSELDCSQCTHFRQHYVLSAGVYVPLNYGHCVARRRKKLAADSECCEHFMRAEKEEVPVHQKYAFHIEIEKLSSALSQSGDRSNAAPARSPPPDFRHSRLTE